MEASKRKIELARQLPDTTAFYMIQRREGAQPLFSIALNGSDTHSHP